MAEYQLLRGGAALRKSTGENFPLAPGNPAYADFLAWLVADAKNVPDPSDPEPVDPPDPEREALHAILDKADAEITAAERNRILLRMARRLRARGEL